MAARLVVAGVLLEDGRVLLCHRKPDRAWYPDVWDLPGGHVEGSETAEAALVWELAQEVRAQVAIPTRPAVARIRAEACELLIYCVETWRGPGT